MLPWLFKQFTEDNTLFAWRGKKKEKNHRRLSRQHHNFNKLYQYTLKTKLVKLKAWGQDLSQCELEELRFSPAEAGGLITRDIPIWDDFFLFFKKQKIIFLSYKPNLFTTVYAVPRIMSRS